MKIKGLFLLALMLPVIYIGTIFWRVSVAEIELFGRSDLLPLQSKKPEYKQQLLGPPGSFGSPYFRFKREGKRLKVFVWKEKINAFQHIYGSALSAYELGEKPADLLFCGNEYVNAFWHFTFSDEGIEAKDLRDRRKDLYHNQTGRSIGMKAKELNLSGQEAENHIKKQVTSQMKRWQGYIPHYLSPAVDKLPSESKMGCPFLPPIISKSSITGL